MTAVDVSKLCNKAKEAVERRNYGLAIHCYKQALTFQPENTDARAKLRVIQTRAVSERGSPRAAQYAGAIWPLVRAGLLAGVGRHEQAILACEDALTSAPSWVAPMRLLASSATKLAAKTQDPRWHQLACWQRGEVISRYAPNDTKLLWSQKDGLATLGRTQEAIEICEKGKQIKPDLDWDASIRNIAATETATIYKEGVEKGATTIVKNEDERRELEDESQIARTDEMRRRKVEALQRRFEERPDDYRLLLRIGDVWYDLEDFEEGYEKAKEAYRRAKEMMPSDHNIDAKLGDLEIKRLRRQVAAARDALDQAEGEDPEAKSRYTEAVKALKKFQLQEYEDRVRHQPLRSGYHHDLAKVYQETKQYDKAVAEYQQSCKDAHFSVEAYTRMGQCFAEMGDLESAIGMYHRAMRGQELFERIREPIYWLGDALERAGRLEEAIKEFSKIYEEDITYRDVRQRVESLRQRLRSAGQEAAEPREGAAGQ